MRSNTSLDLSRDFTQGCGGSFENWHCLIPLISGQSEGEIFSLPNQTKPRVHLAYYSRLHFWSPRGVQFPWIRASSHSGSSTKNITGRRTLVTSEWTRTSMHEEKHPSGIGILLEKFMPKISPLNRVPKKVMAFPPTVRKYHVFYLT
jgi:hypothetical protein